MCDQTVQLTHMWIDITSKCNNRCPYCYDMGNGNKDVELSELKDIFGLIRQISPPNIILIGGEPTLHREFEKVLKLANEINPPTIVTNGTMFAKKNFCERVFNIGVGSILFSLTSPYEKEHDFITQRVGSYQELMHGIYNSMCFLPLEKIRTSTTITKDNVNQLEQIIDLNRQLGLSRTIFNACVPSIADIQGKSCLEPTELAKAIERLYVYCKKKLHSLKIATNLPYCIFDETIRDELRKSNVIFTAPCQIYRGSGYEILSTGAIVPCTHLHDCILENPIKKKMNGEEFLSFINSERMQMFRKQLWKYPSSECKKCSEWGKCVGGCPLMWNAFNANEFVKAI